VTNLNLNLNLGVGVGVGVGVWNKVQAVGRGGSPLCCGVLWSVVPLDLATRVAVCGHAWI
jgi:hypothetical protein